MKKRGKILLSLLICVMCVSLLITGVYASSTISFTTTSTLNFTPTDAYAGISIRTYQGNTNDESSFGELTDTGFTLEQIKNFTPDASNNGFPIKTEAPKNAFISGTGEITSWQTGEVILYLAKPTIRYEVTIYNYSKYAIQFTPSYSFNTTGEQTGGGSNLQVTAKKVDGSTVSDYTFNQPSNTAIQISAPTGTTPTSITFRVDITVPNNDNAIDTGISSTFDIAKA